jgi:tRNA pseudouridine32 synthase/23S rRNA pseudouridine746 synthase
MADLKTYFTPIASPEDCDLSTDALADSQCRSYCESCRHEHALDDSLARRYCLELMRRLEQDSRLDYEASPTEWSPDLHTDYLFGEARGQMFGVLVCRNQTGMLGVLKAFSCQYNGHWLVPGWVPPVFDHDALMPYQRQVEGEIKRLGEALQHCPAGSARHGSLKARRRDLSRGLMSHIHDHYTLGNFAGERRPLKAFFAGGGVPTGAADCCAPKLLDFAAKNSLQPLSLAEFYWGGENRSQTRQHGRFYPPCREKCQPILGFMLHGAEHLEVVYADASIVVVNKPAGLLSIPGKGPDKQDCVVGRVRARFPEATGPLAAHRLDMATSGLMVLGLTPETHRALSIQFQNRSTSKTYIAVLEGEPVEEHGVVELPFRVDLDNRPYQILDPIHGKMGKTLWRKLAKEGERCRVEFTPITGRTHQLRVHSAHSAGLGRPIVGDPLYGNPDLAERLLLHASQLNFTHPVTDRPLAFHSPAPF